MALWFEDVSIEDIEAHSRATAASHCGIRITGIGDDWIEGVIPLDVRNRDIEGNLHPGALSLLAETLGSVAAVLCVDRSRRVCVGQILHVSHPLSAATGPVSAKAMPVSILEDSHIWDIEMRTSDGTLIAVARLTVAVLDRVAPT
jgi:1,4-dihydroxy-2-naphthoyl-CoA hydrolase